MSTLLNVVKRANGNLFDVEAWLARENVGDDDEAGMPPVAGGAL